MDRILLSIATTLLVFQSYLLFANVDIFPQWTGVESLTPREKIGAVVEKRMNVKRKGPDSIVWEDSETHESLHVYDSILTLDNSSAKIRIKNDIEIELSENTLVVLDQETQTDSNEIKLRFSRGHLHTQTASNMKVQSDEWTVSVAKGSNLVLKTLKDGELEIEVEKGKASVQADKMETLQVDEGQRLSLDKTDPPLLQNISKSLKFTNTKIDRLYVKEVPITRRYSWEGNASQLRVILPDQTTSFLEIEPGQQSISLPFRYGIHHLSLMKDNEVSSELTVDVRTKPKMLYSSPFPRDRYEITNSILFSWFHLESAVRYYIETGKTKNLRHTKENYFLSERTQRENLLGYTESQVFPTDRYFHKVSDVKEIGELEFQVWAEDSDGYLIPPDYSQVFYNLEDPFAAPVLREPSSNKTPAPKEKSPSKEKPDDQTWQQQEKSKFWSHIWQLLFPKAHADENDGYVGKTAPLTKKDHPIVVFSWHPVNGADFYQIEISTQPDFAFPDVLTKVEKDSYHWSDYKKTVYYWRVAAGSNSGRMGLFSAPAKIDLTQIYKMPSGPIAPGVRIEKPETPVVTKKTAPAPITKPQPVVVQKEEPPQPLSWTAFAQLNLHHYYYSHDANIAASHEGFVPLSLTMGLSGQSSSENRASYYLKMRYSLVDWVPKDKADLPYQKNLKTSHFKFTATRSFLEPDMVIGIATDTLPLPKRVAHESIEFETTQLFGPIAGLNFDIKSSRVETLGGFLFGNGYTSVWASTNFIYPLGATNNPFYAGADLDLEIHFGHDSASGFQNTAGLFIGKQW